MNKIPTLFVRTEDRRHVTRTITPGCEWVLAGDGVATRKYDGTCVMHDGTNWWARREVKPGKTPPTGYVALSTDDVTGRTVGWEPIGQSGFSAFHARAVIVRDTWPAGTYELCGPRINGNPEGVTRDVLYRHATAEQLGETELRDARTLERDVDLIESAVRQLGWEGLVFHHPDGRMAKIKARDFPQVGA
ncbi:hypothetical protein [Streptomyces sp. NPDC057910]|uniref:hypothetical protein n=1 Tax=Streptomyces sp. NPDC057910 TaxID=3346278 RepID=UPI0036ED5C3B